MRSRMLGIEAPGSPEKNRMRIPKSRGSMPSLGGDLGQAQRVGGRAVERLRLHLGHPVDGALALARDAGAERERGGAEALGARQRRPRAHVEAEHGADEDGVRRADAHPPHDPRVGVGDRAPVVAADAERGRAAGGARGAVHAHDLGRLDTAVGAERRVLGLVGAQLVLGDHREALEVLERLDVAGLDARGAPAAAVERRPLVGVGADLLDALEDGGVALLGVHRLALGEPVLLAGRREVGVVVGGREAPGLH